MGRYGSMQLEVEKYFLTLTVVVEVVYQFKLSMDGKNCVFKKETRLLTHKLMVRRGFNCSPNCDSCVLGEVESILHLFFTCPKAIQLWDRMEAILGVRLMTREETVKDTWKKSMSDAARMGMGTKQWSVYFISTCWTIWKQRNKKIFERKEFPLKMIEECALQDAKLWMQYC
ncbi:uncharacterized protein LOC144560243 [Carex rostrata]